MKNNQPKIAIFLIGSGIHMLDFYNFNQLNQNTAFELVAMVNQDILSSFPEKQKMYFDRIYSISKNKNPSLSHLDLDQLEDAIKQELTHSGNPNNIRIFPFNEYNVLIAANLREKFDIPGAHSKLLIPFRDKVIMKKVLQKKHIRVPHFAVLDMVKIHAEASVYFNELVSLLGLPFMVKPIDGAGSLGVKKIDSEQDFLIFKNELLTTVAGYEAKEFLDGELFHCEVVYQNQQPLITLCGRHNRPLLEFKSGQTISSIPLLDTHPLKTPLIHFTHEILAHFELPDGIIHTEIFYLEKTKEWVFLESAARAPGALIVPMYEQSFGYNLLDLDFLVQMKRFQLRETSPKSYSFWAIIPPIPGKLKNMIKPTIQSEYRLEWFANTGSMLMQPVSLRDRVGRIFVWNQDYDILLEDFECISNHCFMEIES